jgi:transposase-like protein
MTQPKDTLMKELLQIVQQEGPESFRSLLQTVCLAVLEAQMTPFLQAEPYERTEQRRGYRKGYKPRTLTTRLGTLELRVPQDREGRFSTSLFARYQRSEQALLLCLQEMYLKGVSTRQVRQITEALCEAGFSAPDLATAQQRLRQVIEGYRASYPRLADWLEQTGEEALAVFHLPEAHRGRLRSTNGLEAFMGEGDRRTRVVRIFPDEGSCLRLIAALAMEQSETWLMGPRYLDRRALEEWEGLKLQAEAKEVAMA